MNAGDFQSAFEFSDLALCLAAMCEDPRLQAIVLFRYGFFLNPWRCHMANRLAYLQQGFAALVQTGDFLYAGYTGIDVVELSLVKGDRLDDVWETCRQYAGVVPQNDRNRYTFQLQQHFIACLKGSPYDRLWADNCPQNFAPRYALLAAEVARLDGQDLEAMRLYEQAIRSARENEFIQIEAIADELAGRFYLDRDLETNGCAHLRDARVCYVLWGANSKVRHLDQLYPRLAAPDRAAATSDTPVQQLDVTA